MMPEDTVRDTTARRARILILDDDRKLAELEKEMLTEAGYDIDVATGIAQGRKLAQDAFFDLLLLDERLPTGSGAEFFKECRERYPDIGAVFLTAYPDIELARDVFRAGALDFLVKGISRDQLLISVEEALHRSRLKREARFLRRALQKDASKTGIVGESPALKECVRLATKAATVDVPILLEGESGTGKEVFARAIHSMSARRAKPLVCLNTGAIPQTLLESTLFGHARGAFTGAYEHRQGSFEAANEGTIFLDEIGEMSREAQVRLLRVLDQRSVTRVGETTSIPVDVRIIAATNRDLYEEVSRGAFRRDLFYRLAVFSVRLPPLRDRYGDVPLLSRYFLDGAATDMHREIAGFHPDALDMLNRQAWPGNVRELRNVVERAVILCDGDTIQPKDLLLEPGAGMPSQELLSEPWDEAQKRFGRAYFEALLKRCGGNKSEAAKSAGVDRSTIYECIERFRVRQME